MVERIKSTFDSPVLAKLVQSINPAQVGTKEALKRSLILLAIVVAVIAVIAAAIEMVGLLAVVLFGVGGTVLTSMPRWMAIWFQYRGFLVEFGFGYACLVLLGGSMAFKAIILIAAAAGAVTFLKRFNLHYKDYDPVENPGGSKNTLYETWLMGINGNVKLTLWQKFLTSSNKTLRPDFYYDQAKEGFGGYRVFCWSLFHSLWIIITGEKERDFFMETLPSGKVPWWKSMFMSKGMRTLAQEQAEENLLQAKHIIALRAVLRQQEHRLEQLLNINENERQPAQHDECYKLRRNIWKIRDDLKEMVA